MPSGPASCSTWPRRGWSERKILLPGVTTLTRLVAAVRDRAAQRLWRRLAELPDTEVRQHLEGLLVVPVGGRQTPLDRLRTTPVRASAPALVDALHRLDEVRALGAGRVDLSPACLQDG